MRQMIQILNQLKRIALMVMLFAANSIHQSKAQCTPGFLGSDRPLIQCTPAISIDYVNLFQVQAAYSATALLPATDTIKRNGQPDTVVFHSVKLQVIATLPGGCKDTAIIRIPFNRDPYPNAGPDASFIICRGSTKDLSLLYQPNPLFNPVWSLPNPALADTGKHSLTITTRDGCTDNAEVTITHFPYILFGPDSTVSRKPGEKVNLFKLIDTAKFVSITWNTNTPASAPIGTYWAIGVDINGCRDTALLEVCKKPDMRADTTIKVCPGLTTNLYGVYDLAGLLPAFNTQNPSAAGVGIYRLIVTNYCGGKDTVNINVINGIKPNIGIDLSKEICENETTNMVTLYTLGSLIPTWSISNPEQAPPGVHRLVVKNADGCKDTSFITVAAFPRKPYYNDTTVYVCGTQTKDLTKIYPIGPEAFADWVNASNPLAATEGVYTLAIEEDGCRYELKVTVASEATRNASISLCTYNTTTTGIFSTNNFRSVIVDKQGVIWAGANGNGTSGGLYRFTRTGPGCAQGSWSASTAFPNSTYRDLHLSNIVGDNAVWSASSGHSLSQAISGGVYRINSLNSVTRFGSKLDTDGTLSSRLVTSLAVAPNGKLYAGMSVSQTGAGVIGEGDVYEYNLATSPAAFLETPNLNFNFANNNISAIGMRGTELWIAVQRSCNNGTCVDPYIQRWNTNTNSSLGTVTEAFSPIKFTTNSGIIVRAIFTSSTQKTFVGLNTSQGFAVMEKPTANGPEKWTLLTSDNSAFPTGAAVNSNAISEINGEIWIGTNNGLLVYDGVGSLTECSSYTLYNTTNGLPSNNVTDIAYDLLNQEVWITSDAGVSKVTKTFLISGKVLNVFFGKYEKDLHPRMFTRNIENAKVMLRNAGGEKIDSSITNNKGEFDLSKTLAGQQYKVTINYKTFEYEYSNVLANSYMGDVLLPDSLIKDIDSLKTNLKEKEIAYTFPAEKTYSLIWKIPTFKISGFDTTGYEKSYEVYKSVVRDKHELRLENLALYYLTLSTINDIGNLSGALADQAISQGIEIITGLAEFKTSMDKLVDFQELWKKGASNSTTSPGLVKDFVEGINKLVDDGKEDALKLLRAKMEELLDENLRNAKGLDGKPLLDTNSIVLFDVLKTVLNQVADQLLLKEDGLANLTKDDLKEQAQKYATAYIVKLIGGVYYKYYTQVKHKGLIPKLAQYSRDAISNRQYGEVYKSIYDKGIVNADAPASIHKQAIDLSEDAGDQIQTETELAKSSKNWSDITKTASNFALSTVILAEVAPVLRSFSLALEGLNLGLQGVSMGTAILAAVQVGNLSDEVVGKTGFPALKTKATVLNENCFPVSVTALTQAVKEYNKKLNDYRILISTGFDSTMEYTKRYRAVLNADSVYQEQLSILTNQIAARYKNASSIIPDFEGNYHALNTNFLSKQSSSRAAFLIENISYILTPIKSTIAPRVDSLINDIIANNFAAVSMLNGMVAAINQYCIPSGAFLVKTGFKLVTNYAPAGNGTFSYTFTNYGGTPQNMVRFKITPPTNGFTITSADSIFAGTISPGQSFTVNFSYTAPNADTLGAFTLLVKAANGIYRNEEGLLITTLAANNTAPVSIKAGNWNDPTVWSTGQVPTAISAVTIRHTVTVNVDATVKSLKAEIPAQVTVATGKKLTVLQ